MSSSIFRRCQTSLDTRAVDTEQRMQQRRIGLYEPIDHGKVSCPGLETDPDLAKKPAV